jgi:hypothetical protein
VPSSYQRDLHNRLQNLRQGTKSVDDYYKEMELLLIRSGVREDPESKMARFFHDLNAKFQDLLKCFHTTICMTLLIKLCAQKEKFNKRSMVDHFQQYHDINNSQIQLFLEVSLKVLHQGVLYLILLLRQHHLWLLHLHHALKASVLLQP